LFLKGFIIITKKFAFEFDLIASTELEFLKDVIIALLGDKFKDKFPHKK